jgi:hypothetical protein
LNRLEK